MTRASIKQWERRMQYNYHIVTAHYSIPCPRHTLQGLLIAGSPSTATQHNTALFDHQETLPRLLPRLFLMQQDLSTLCDFTRLSDKRVTLNPRPRSWDRSALRLTRRWFWQWFGLSGFQITAPRQQPSQPQSVSPFPRSLYLDRRGRLPALHLVLNQPP